jgi:hypothetical protein
LLALGGLAVFLIQQNKTSQTEIVRQQRLAALVAKLPVPAGCVRVHEEYKAANGGTVPGWTIYYMCKTTGGAAYDTITAATRSLAVRSETNRSVAADAESSAVQLRYDFSYVTADARLHYEFMPEGNYATAEDLRASQVTSIWLTVSDLT